jgi:PAS domain S-box-containing protein
MLDPEGKILTWNEGAARNQGYTAQEVVGQNFLMFYTPEDQARKHPQEELRLARVNGVYEEEGIRVRKDGSRFWANVILTPVYDNEKKLVGFAKVVRNITEKKEGQEKLRKAFEEVKRKSEDLEIANQVALRKGLELQASNQELEAFCYSVSHDLRSPLRGIAGFAQALDEDYGKALDARAKRYLDRIRAGAQRMGALIDDLLNLSRLTRAQLRPSAIDLTEISESVIQELQASDPDRKIKIEIQPRLNAEGDPGLIRAALDNLIRNAWKFTSKKDDAAIEIGKQLQGEQEVFFVKDNGAGFDMAFADKLFGAFQRLHAVDEFPGTGIGLATVRRIIHRHGGKVWVEAKEGVGATFYFTLPDARLPKPETKAA